MFLGLDKKDINRLALVDAEGSRLTYGELCNSIAEMQKKLPGRTLAFCLCTNTVECAIGYLAMVDAGVVPVMLSTKTDTELLKALTIEYRPSLVWRPKGCLLPGEHSLYKNMTYELVATGDDNCPMNDLLELCMSTSGSTGSPKLVRYKRGNLEANAKNVALAFGWTSEERAFADLGMQYTMGLNVVNTHLYVGATVLLCDRNILSSDYWDFLRNEKATNITGVPFSYDIFSRLNFMQMELPHLRTLAEGGGKLTDARFKELAEYANRTSRRFFATFGTTETSARLSYLPPNLAIMKTGSIGRAIPEGKLDLLDESGNVIKDDVAEGELCYSGPNVTMGYANTRNDLLRGDDWLGTYRTGDIARRDTDGCYYITGRISRFVKLLGHRIGLDECEQILKTMSGVTCACVGDDEQVRVYAEAPADPEKLVRCLSSALKLRASLFSVRVLSRLPRNESGKVLYKTLD